MGSSRRGELTALLTVGAQLEHSLACQYLFSAFSLKRSTDEGLTDEQLGDVVQWQRTILLVARQEMEHLGLVLNLLSAIGGAPEFRHPRFPYSTHLFGHQMALERFSVPTLQRFVCFERPEDIEPDDAFCLPPPTSGGIGGSPAEPYATVGELYELIRTTLLEAAAEPGELFVGPPDAQLGGGEIGTDFARLGAMGGGYDVYLSPVTDLASALGAIDRIIEQGEGAPADHEIAHFRRFLDILESLESRDPPFDPARPVVSNPTLGQPVGLEPGTLVTNPVAREAMGLFDDAYRVMLMTLVRLMAHTDETPENLSVLLSVAFMPMMTMAVRPLAEVLTLLPAQEPDDGATAGPAFDAGTTIALLPHRQTAWTVIEEELRSVADRALAFAATPGAPARLPYIARSLDLIARRFAAGMGINARL
jgi:Ferritin-like